MVEPKRKAAGPPREPVAGDWRHRFTPDTMGMLVGVALATVVLAVGFLRGVEEFEAIFRAILTFALSWCATVVLATIVYRIHDRELAPPSRPGAEQTDTDGKSKGPESAPGEPE